MTIPSLQTKDIPRGTRVLVRASLNAPVADGKVVGTFRLRETARTIRFLKERGARITVIGHFGREGKSLAPVHRALNEILPISFVPKLTGEEPYQARKQLQPGDAVLLENTRTDPREETVDILFIEELAAQTDLFVFDDFSAAHRSHASTTGLIRYLKSYAGIRFYEEITAFRRITERLVTPAIAVVAGAKCATKLPLLVALAQKYDTVFVGGVIANTLLKLRGHAVGISGTEEVSVPEILRTGTNIILPCDVLAVKGNEKARVVPVEEIKPDDRIVDVGDRTISAILRRLEDAKTVMWNGPLGWYEKGFSGRTKELVNGIGKTQAYSFVGGGDTAAMLERYGMLGIPQFVSTGGGSLLTYFAEGTLPVIDAFAEKTPKQPSVSALSSL